jgi:hypothetical protein
MKKGLATLLVLLALFAAAEPASAGTCRRRVTLRRSYSRAYYRRLRAQLPGLQRPANRVLRPQPAQPLVEAPG